MALIFLGPAEACLLIISCSFFLCFNLFHGCLPFMQFSFSDRRLGIVFALIKFGNIIDLIVKMYSKKKVQQKQLKPNDFYLQNETATCQFL